MKVMVGYEDGNGEIYRWSVTVGSDRKYNGEIYRWSVTVGSDRKYNGEIYRWSVTVGSGRKYNSELLINHILRVWLPKQFNNTYLNKFFRISLSQVEFSSYE